MYFLTGTTTAFSGDVPSQFARDPADKWLYVKGQQLTRQAIAKINPLLKKMAAEKEQPKPKGFLMEMADPFLKPLMAGAKDEAQRQAQKFKMPVIAVAAGAITVIFLGGVFLGFRLRRR